MKESMKEMFALTAVNSDGNDVYSVTIHKTFEKAQAEMERQYKREVKKIAYDNEWEEDEVEGEISEDFAWVLYNGEDEHYQWQITKVYIPE